MNKIKCNYQLCDNVKIGEKDNPVVYTPINGSFVVDIETLDFLTAIRDGHDIELPMNDTETMQSIELLINCGIIKECNDDDNLKNNKRQYEEKITDLFISRDISWLTVAFQKIGKHLSIMITPLFISIGFILCVIVSIYFLLFYPSKIIISVFQNSFISWIVISILLLQVRLFWHELGHFSGGLKAGINPKSGIGIYFSGPVAYVDLSAIDVCSKKMRIMADLAGLAMDGYFLSILTVVSFIVKNDLFTSVVVGISMNVFFTFSLTEKSDIYWALKDLFNSRASTVTWAEPIKFIQQLRNDKSQRLFLTVLLIGYLLHFVISLIITFRWSIEFILNIKNMNPMQIIQFILPLVIFIIVYICWIIFIRIKKNRKGD